MFKNRKSKDRGHFDHGWLNTFHSFSFDQYHDPLFMGYSDLRVINEDTIQGGEGFPTHGHRDMEIITYVVDGALEHKDTLGNTTVIRPGDVQRMSAGTGIRHSEFNHMSDRPTHLLQIWILPEKPFIQPSYAQKSFLKNFENNHFLLVGSKDGKDGSVIIHQDVNMYVGKFKPKDSKEFTVQNNRKAWIQLVHGSLLVGAPDVNYVNLSTGDGLAIENEKNIFIKADENSEFILFDLAP